MKKKNTSTGSNQAPLALIVSTFRSQETYSLLLECLSNQKLIYTDVSACFDGNNKVVDTASDQNGQQFSSILVTLSSCP